MAEDVALDLEELHHFRRIAKRPRIVSLISSEIRNLEKMPLINQEEKDGITARWNPREERIFIELMADEVRKGNRPTTTFSKRVWNGIYEKFYTQTGYRYTPQQFKNKFNKLRQHLREFKKLRNGQTGFCWNQITKTVTASDEVWDSYIKINPYAKHFRNRGCPMFEELMTIYGDTITNSETTKASTQGTQDIDDDATNDDVLRLDLIPKTQYEEVVEDVGGDADVVEEAIRSGRSRSRTPTSRRGKESKNGAFTDSCKAFTVNQQITYPNASSNAEEDPFSIRICCDLLSTIDNVREEMYVKALKMFQDRGWRETFVSVPADRRLWLLRSLQ